MIDTGLRDKVVLVTGAQHGITVNIVSPGPIQTGWMTPEVEATRYFTLARKTILNIALAIRAQALGSSQAQML